MRPLISVIIPVYMSESFIERCLQGVANQTYKELEVILVDDASTDQTVALCQAFCQRDERFRLIALTSNGGAGTARQCGVAEAKGEFICFIDSDDLVSPYYVENLWTAIEQTGADLAVSRLQRSQEITTSFLDTRGSAFQLFTTDEVLKKVFLHQIHVAFYAKLYRRDLLMQVPISVKRRFQDMDWFYRHVLQVRTVVWSEATDYIYIQRPSSLSYSLYFDQQFYDMAENCKDCVAIINQTKPYLNDYARMFAWLHLYHQLFRRTAFLGKNDRLFFYELRQYRQGIWKLARLHQKPCILAAYCPYPIFRLYRRYEPFFIKCYSSLYRLYVKVHQTRGVRWVARHLRKKK